MIIAALETFHADQDSSHAADVDSATMKTFVRESNCPVTFMQYATGLRHRDLIRLRRRQIILRDDGVHLDVRVTKGIRKKGKRRFVVFPYWFDHPTKDVKKFITQGDPDERLLSKPSYSEG